METGQYSIQLVTEALITASTQASGSAGDVAGIVRSHLLPLMDILEASGAAFYPVHEGHVIAVNASGRREVSAPDRLSPATQAYIRHLPHQAVTSQDSVFSMNHIRNMPVMNAASSLWAAAGEAGTVALFDLSVRDFSKAEQQIVRMFAFQMASHLTLSQASKPPAQAHHDSSLDHYLDASKLMAFVSRDLINPLTAMLGYIELLKGEKLGERGAHYLAKLQEQVEKTHKIVMAVGAHPIPAAHAIGQMSAADASAGPQPMHSGRPEYKIPGVHPEAAVPQPTRPVTIPPARVLIIQKNEATLEFKRTVLSALATDVIATFSGTEAIQLLQKEDLQGVILDDEMDGEWPGRKLYGWICEHRPELRERVLLTVSNHPRPDILELIEDNHVPHVSKPLQMVELFSGMQQILNPQGGRSSKHLN
jgi:signal transduction histidine kinase